LHAFVGVLFVCLCVCAFLVMCVLACGVRVCACVRACVCACVRACALCVLRGACARRGKRAVRKGCCEPRNRAPGARGPSHEARAPPLPAAAAAAPSPPPVRTRRLRARGPWRDGHRVHDARDEAGLADQVARLIGGEGEGGGGACWCEGGAVRGRRLPPGAPRGAGAGAPSNTKHKQARSKRCNEPQSVTTEVCRTQIRTKRDVVGRKHNASPLPQPPPPRRYEVLLDERLPPGRRPASEAPRPPPAPRPSPKQHAPPAPSASERSRKARQKHNIAVQSWPKRAGTENSEKASRPPRPAPV
jgi:hypothetical protein